MENTVTEKRPCHVHPLYTRALAHNRQLYKRLQLYDEHSRLLQTSDNQDSTKNLPTLLTLSFSTHLSTLSLPPKKKESKRHFEDTVARKSIFCYQGMILIELFSLLKLSFLIIIKRLKSGPPLTRV